MALSTYTELQASVANWLNRVDLTSDIVDFIALAEAKMNHGIAIDPDRTISLRVDEMKTSTTVLIGTTDDDVTRTVFPIPSDLLDLEEIRPTGTWDGDDGDEVVTALSPAKPYLERVSNHRLESWVVGAGWPAFFSNDPTGDNWNIWPRTANYQITAWYWEDVPALASNPTSEILTRYPDVYLYGALQEAEAFLKLENTTWRKQFIAAIASANQMTKRKSWAGSDLRTRNPYGWSRVI